MAETVVYINLWRISALYITFFIYTSLITHNTKEGLTSQFLQSSYHFPNIHVNLFNCES